MPVQEVINARNLVKSFKSVRAVDGVNLSVHAGERVALLGPNGAGKTTTLMMLLGAVLPDEGSVEVLGYRLPKQRSAAMHKIGFASGYLYFPFKLKVRDILSIFAGLYGVPDPTSAIEAGLERFGIPHLINSIGSDLSSGQRTLLGIVKATLHNPELLILDEPTASLDPEVSLRVRTGLQSMNEESGVTLLITSHNMVEVERLCDRIVFISKGRIVADDTPEEVVRRFDREDLEDVFVGLAEETKRDNER